MTTTRLSIPFLALTRQRKASFLAWALQGFSSASKAISITRCNSLGKTSGTRSSELESSPQTEGSQATALIVPSVAGRSESAGPQNSMKKFGNSCNGRSIMLGTRRNGHCMSCTCKGCAELVAEDAEKFFSQGKLEP